VTFRPELERLCYAPEQSEKREKFDEQAREVLEYVGWARGVASM
jgi:hypothetical protein